MNDRWDSQPSNLQTNFSTPAKNEKKKNQGTTKEGQGRAGESGNQDGSNRHHLDPSMDSLTRAMGKIQKWLRCN